MESSVSAKSQRQKCSELPVFSYGSPFLPSCNSDFYLRTQNIFFSIIWILILLYLFCTLSVDLNLLSHYFLIMQTIQLWLYEKIKKFCPRSIWFTASEYANYSRYFQIIVSCRHATSTTLLAAWYKGQRIGQS